MSYVLSRVQTSGQLRFTVAGLYGWARLFSRRGSNRDLSQIALDSQKTNGAASGVLARRLAFYALPSDHLFLF